jgi:hypothetical protein
MFKQKPKILLRPVGASRWQSRLPASCLSNRPGINGIRLARASRATPSKTHKLGRDTDNRFPLREKEPVERPRDVAAVLYCELALIVKRTGPLEQTREAHPTRVDREFGHDAANRCVNGHRRVQLLVRVNTDYDHSGSPSGADNEGGLAGGQLSIGGAVPTLLLGHAGEPSTGNEGQHPYRSTLWVTAIVGVTSSSVRGYPIGDRRSEIGHRPS